MGLLTRDVLFLLGFLTALLPAVIPGPASSTTAPAYVTNIQALTGEDWSPYAYQANPPAAGLVVLGYWSPGDGGGAISSV